MNKRDLNCELDYLFRKIAGVPTNNFSTEDLSVLKRMKTLYKKLNLPDWEKCWNQIYQDNLAELGLEDEDIEEYKEQNNA